MTFAPELNQFARHALPVTLLQAYRHPFYAAHWSRQGVAIEELERRRVPARELMALFQSLPLTTRADLQTKIVPRLEDGDSITSISHTTGSTGTVAYRFRSRAEAQRISQLLEPSLKRPEGPRPIVLTLNGPFHGHMNVNLPTLDSRQAYSYHAGIWDDYFADQAAKLITQQFDIPGFDRFVHHIHADIRYIRVFTQYLIDTGISAGMTKIKSIAVHSGYQALEVKAFLSSFWGFDPVELFGLSEFRGGVGAPKCPRCGHIAFEPHLLPEVVDYESESPIAGGPGRLLITELYPFGHCQPLIRYATGDIAERILEHDACTAHIGGIRQLGRVSQSVFMGERGGQRLLIPSNSLREAVYCPAVAKSGDFPQLTKLRNQSMLGLPVAWTTIEEAPGQARVLLRFKPGRVDNPASFLKNRMLSLSKSLESAVNEGCVVFDVVPDWDLAHLVHK